MENLIAWMLGAITHFVGWIMETISKIRKYWHKGTLYKTKSWEIERGMKLQFKINEAYNIALDYLNNQKNKASGEISIDEQLIGNILFETPGNLENEIINGVWKKLSDNNHIYYDKETRISYYKG